MDRTIVVVAFGVSIVVLILASLVTPGTSSSHHFRIMNTNCKLEEESVKILEGELSKMRKKYCQNAAKNVERSFC